MIEKKILKNKTTIVASMINDLIAKSVLIIYFN